MSKVNYKCLYNHELLILATSQTPHQSYEDPLGDAQTIGLVEELRGTGVDALMICPQAWMTNLWHSEIDRRWQDIAPHEHEPRFEQNLKYPAKAYHRIRRYILDGHDPVKLTIETARRCGIAPIFSYRMNEHHYTNNPDVPTHSRFWKEHQHLMLEDGGSNLNYLDDEVRAYYLALISELLELHDVDGFECDFMRYPRYFPDDKIAEGIPVMTTFVAKIRQKLDELGQKRGKHLALSVRVPRSPKHALDIGLDVRAWHDAGLIDMVNASSMFRISQEVDIEGYASFLKNTSLYGEMHFVTQPGEAPGHYWVNVNRLTPRELYHSTALSYLERGADGVSLFNFAYTRDHSFGEPRKSYHPGVEPPFDVIPTLVSKEKLRASSQLVTLTPGFDQLPKRITGQTTKQFRLHIGNIFDPTNTTPFAAALLRIEADDYYIAHRPIQVSVNGQLLRPVMFNGEPFPPPSLEALPDPLKLCH